MKHNFKITSILLILFLLTQVIGLIIIANYITIEEKIETKEVMKDGKLVTEEVIVKEQTWANLPYDIERPKVEEKSSYIATIVSLLIATFIALVLIKFEARILWRIWFFLSVWFTLAVAFNAFIMQNIAIIIALILAILKAFKNNVYIHNFTELFIYGGLAVIFVPILNIFSIIILLILISLYDAYAVWKSKHMIKMAKFQTKLKLFAGLFIPYGKNKTAILGGGDLGFPLLFTGVVFKTSGWEALFVIAMAAIALWLLLIKSEKNKFYPAMPFIAAGCLVGYGITLLV